MLNETPPLLLALPSREDVIQVGKCDSTPHHPHLSQLISSSWLQMQKHTFWTSM